MKNNVRFIAIAVMIFVLTSCDDFIDKAPIEQVIAEEYFVDEATAESAVLGMYRLMESSSYYGQSMIVITEFSAGHLTHYLNFPEYVTFQQHKIRTDNPWVLTIWTGAYSIINAANNVIEAVPKMTNIFTPGLQSQLTYEAKFVRALVYFNLVRSWGEVPLVTLPTLSVDDDLKIFRKSVDDIYAQIIADLNDAINLPVNYGASAIVKNKGRATQYAAKALLSKVYLYSGKYVEAATFAEDVIKNGGYSLIADYPSIWSLKNTAEAIFELQFDVQTTNPLALVSNPPNATFLASDTTFKLFEGVDVRRNFTINKVGGKLFIGKYRNFNPAIQNVPIIRLAEIYLIYAEAQARVTTHAGDPYLYYKAVRTRAGLTTPDEILFNTESFIRAIQQEKRLELMFEGEAWYDYVRTELALTEMMADNPDPRYFLFPVPQFDLIINDNLTQNDGY